MPTAREKTCPFERGGRGGLWSAEAELPPTLKLALQHFKHVRARLPSPTQWERGWGGGLTRFGKRSLKDGNQLWNLPCDNVPECVFIERKICVREDIPKAAIPRQSTDGY